ncbi:hybrid sensor histidine kinase/response regulator [Chitinophaga pendula]|uniref:ATP-binding response regulator n=1 Tax=Chitinophaga TaxID=79328 RepID=UPI000BB0C959|nr:MULTISPECIES: hybrid sensor histidine kinase/response regulator [Chitinophaga]ASZ10923.1 hybrid sensor histidine kinase/response regulator [Chitinophaga sp. MD30]UCJ06089.1 hybrid sensor histidine kinase/response regulator [Chitinophaga pendula]
MKDNRIRILYIDDEVHNLNAFKASFRRSYEIYTANSAQEGKQLLRSIDVHIIIADQKMPISTGVDFFNEIKDVLPDPIRILLTGYTDVEDIIDAINKGHIYSYIKKPWDENELHRTINNAFEIFTARKQLKEKIEELEKTNDELNRFIYSTSHDLRSPLMSVLGIINLTRLDNSVTDPNGYLDMIESCILKLDGFIQKIIEYYRNSRLEVEYEKIDFSLLLQDCINAFKHQNTAIEFHTQVDQSFDFKGDTFRISVILNNLISNAVKYQKPDEAHPRVNLLVKVEPHKASIIIADNGIGILSEHLNNIFKMFFRSKNNNKPGSGIGLYIVKEALNKIGGTINVESKYGEGTQFEITIPNRNDFDT